MDSHGEPENKAKADLEGFVVKQALSEMSSRPAAEHAEKMQSSFRNSGLFPDRSPFIDTVQDECNGTAGHGQQQIDCKKCRNFGFFASQREIKQDGRSRQPKKCPGGKPALHPTKGVHVGQPCSSQEVFL